MKKISYNKEDECNEDVFAPKKEKVYLFLTTSRFKFLDVKNYIGPGLNFDAWCKSMSCRLQKNSEEKQQRGQKKLLAVMKGKKDPFVHSPD